MDRSKIRWSQLKVGVIAFAAVIILALLILLLTGSRGIFQHNEIIRTYLDDASGIAESTPVRLNGILVGAVQVVRLLAKLAATSGAAASAGPDLTVVADASGVPEGFSPAAVVLAVKPQSAAEALPPHARFAGKAVFLSIMAGRTIGGISGNSAGLSKASPRSRAACATCSRCGTIRAVTNLRPSPTARACWI